jgi:hypothetical protein
VGVGHNKKGKKSIYFKSLEDSFTIIFYANAFLINMQDYGHDRCARSTNFAWHIYMMLIF